LKGNFEMAVQADFIKWEQEAKQCDIAALHHIINDCREARDAMRGWNPDKEAYYADQYWTFSDELRRRTLVVCD
jgi:hypothetical protein